MSDKLPALQQFAGHQAERLSGIKSWENLKILGHNNLERIRQLAQENIYRMMSSHESSEDIKQIKHGIDYVAENLISGPVQKPMLPRLRNESFRRGDDVFVYLGDTGGAIDGQGWVRGKVVDVSKAFNKDWADGNPNSGYFWKVTVETMRNIFPNENRLVFSTSEPRVIFDWEYDYLKHGGDADFLQIYSDNAFREWQPLWCLEKNLICRPSDMNMKKWIEDGKVIE